MKENKNKKKKLGKELFDGKLGKVPGGNSISDTPLLAYGGPNFDSFNNYGKPKPEQLPLTNSSDSNTFNFNNKKDK